MRLAATITRALQTDLRADLRDLERAVAAGTREADRGFKAELRRQVTSAGLRQRLANGWRDRHFPDRKLDAASLVYTRAPRIIRAFGEGAVIRSKHGRFLAIPTGNAPRKGTDGKRISPSTFPEHRFGPLRFVPRRSGPSLLVVDGLRASFSRKTGEPRGLRRATERARARGMGLATVVMFLFVPQAKLAKRLDVAGAAERWSARLPALIEQRLRAESSMPASKGEQVIEARALGHRHFRPGEGPDYCRACRNDNRPCARGEPGADGRLCPYREHALISRQEHEAWGALLACQGQLRLAPSGHVIGIDMDAALRLAAARGGDLAVLAELLPAAEAGLVGRWVPRQAGLIDARRSGRGSQRR